MDAKEIKKIAVIFLISLFIQIIFLFTFKIPIQKDATHYDEIAMNVISGKGFSADGINPTVGGVKQGYVLILAGIYKIFGHNVLPVKILQILLMAVNCVITYKIGMELFDKEIGFYSGLATAFNPILNIISSHLLSESVFTFFLVLSILYLILAMKKMSFKLYLLAGILLGLSTQMRFTSVLFPFFIAFGLFWFYKDKLYALKASFIVFSTVIVIITPWCIRNYIQFGRFNPFIEHMGIFWMGTYTKGMAHQDSPEFRRASTEAIEDIKNYYLENKMDFHTISMERHVLFSRMAIENLKDDPLGYIALFPRKIFRLWISSYSGLFNISSSFSDFLYNRDLIKRYPFILFWKAFMFLISALIFFLGITGMILNLKIWKKLFPLYLIVVYFALLHMVVFANARLGLPAIPYLIIFSTSSVFLFLNRIKKIRRDIHYNPST